MSSLFEWPVRVYYEDTDAEGVVYYANYLKFYERTRTEWLRSLGISQEILKNKHNIIFVVKNVSIDYRRPALLDDELTVTAGGSAVERRFHVVRAYRFKRGR